jgi:hypothetical protein
MFEVSTAVAFVSFRYGVSAWWRVEADSPSSQQEMTLVGRLKQSSQFHKWSRWRGLCPRFRRRALSSARADRLGLLPAERIHTDGRESLMPPRSNDRSCRHGEHVESK